jgi:hypothetical protein
LKNLLWIFFWEAPGKKSQSINQKENFPFNHENPRIFFGRKSFEKPYNFFWAGGKIAIMERQIFHSTTKTPGFFAWKSFENRLAFFFGPPARGKKIAINGKANFPFNHEKTQDFLHGNPLKTRLEFFFGREKNRNQWKRQIFHSTTKNPGFFAWKSFENPAP